MAKKILLLLLCSCVSAPCWAVKWKECWKKNYADFNKINELHKSKGWLEQTFDFTTQITTMPTLTFIVSGSFFVSSIGPCGMLAKLDQRDEFLAENFFAVKLASAKGGGEYISAVAILSGCEAPEAISAFEEKVRDQFQGIYMNPSAPREVSPREVGFRLDHLINTDSALQKMCRVSS